MLTICTFNIKNNFDLYTSDKAEEIFNFFKNKNIDILCMQELFSKCKIDLLKIIKDTDYKLYGRYRYNLRIFNPINEAVPILTKMKTDYNKTYLLPFLPSLLKRIATIVEVENLEFGKLVIINTHLDYKYDFVKKRQLKKISQLVKKQKYPVILTGDFNLKNNNQVFNDFVKEMEDINLKRVEVNEKTLKQSKYKRAIDHIFVPSNFEVKKVEVIKFLEISDHYPVLVKLEKKN